ncbi:MAG: hypothetical protein K0S95_1495 [Pantoea eucrina]|jgi:hypothetical protein|nr:hypothetical protein [Pantoea eucrina]
MASLGSARELTQGRMNAPPTGGGINVGGALMRPGLRGIERASSRSARESTQGRMNAPPAGGINVGGALMRPGLRDIEWAH